MQTVNPYESPQLQPVPKLKKKRYSMVNIVAIALLILAVLYTIFAIYAANEPAGTWLD